jgi:hypothetical protein
VQGPPAQTVETEDLFLSPFFPPIFAKRFGSNPEQGQSPETSVGVAAIPSNIFGSTPGRLRPHRDPQKGYHPLRNLQPNIFIIDRISFSYTKQLQYLCCHFRRLTKK